jgi:hypothetical protein
MSASLKTCPFCAEEIAEEAIKCKHCWSMLDDSPAESTPVFDYPPVVLTVPIVVSAVWNLLTAATWAFLVPCLGFIVAAPYCVLAAFEIATFQRCRTMSPRELYDRCGWLGGFQILLGVFNLAPVVCGVLLLAYRDRLRDYHPASR